MCGARIAKTGARIVEVRAEMKLEAVRVDQSRTSQRSPALGSCLRRRSYQEVEPLFPEAAPEGCS
jgi:hypothetical protein